MGKHAHGFQWPSQIPSLERFTILRETLINLVCVAKSVAWDSCETFIALKVQESPPDATTVSERLTSNHETVHDSICETVQHCYETCFCPLSVSRNNSWNRQRFKTWDGPIAKSSDCSRSSQSRLTRRPLPFKRRGGCSLEFSQLLEVVGVQAVTHNKTLS